MRYCKSMHAGTSISAPPCIAQGGSGLWDAQVCGDARQVHWAGAELGAAGREVGGGAGGALLRRNCSSTVAAATIAGGGEGQCRHASPGMSLLAVPTPSGMTMGLITAAEAKANVFTLG